MAGKYSHSVHVEDVRRAYAGLADRYIELFGSVGQVHADDLGFIGGHLSGVPGAVLDLGCGPGHLTDYLRSLGVEASGVDVVPEFIAHARATHPDGSFRLGSMDDLDVPDHSVAGILAWFSLIHLPPPDLDGALVGFRRLAAPAGRLVVGFFDAGDGGVEAFDHKVVTAYRWPVDEFAGRLRRAGFAETARLRRPAEDGHRAYAAIAATVTGGPESEMLNPVGTVGAGDSGA